MTVETDETDTAAEEIVATEDNDAAKDACGKYNFPPSYITI